MFSFVNMKNDELENLLSDALYGEVKFHPVKGRYLTNSHLEEFINQFQDNLEFEKIGVSVQQRPVYKCEVGNGKKKILAWSQMHGNEATTTKAVLDLLSLLVNKSRLPLVDRILQEVTMHIIPILNPDGAEAYTRVNANEVDLNRDLQDLSEPESVLLKNQFEMVKPDLCLNLHDQRSIFSAGANPIPATLSFLTPSMDERRSIDEQRKLSMSLIAGMVGHLENDLAGRIGRYDDAFNINCAGDTFQAAGCPTILFEAGHYPGDYEREVTRKYVFRSLVSCLYQVAITGIDAAKYKSYFEIPENAKLFNDVIIRRANLNGGLVDVAIQFKEVLRNGEIDFEPVVVEIASGIDRFAHKEIDARGEELKLPGGGEITENVIVNKIILNTAELQVKYR